MFNNINPNDYQSRLHNSIVRYSGFPVSLEVMGNESFRLRPIHLTSEFKAKEVKSRDLNLDISSPSLGWFNFEYDGVKVALYIVRESVRKWRQGLCSTNTKIFMLTDGKIGLSIYRDAMYSGGFEKMILGEYPNLDEAKETLRISGQIKGNTHSIAVSPNVALGKRDGNLIVYYKKDEVGWISPGSNVVKVPKEENSKFISRFLSELSWKVE